MEDNKEVPQEVNETEVEQERPEINYKAELARKNEEISRLRAEREAESAKPKYDVNDISTWSDNDLKLLRNSPAPEHARYKEQADELLLERKVRAIQARDMENRKKEEASSKVSEMYPEASDPTSEFSRNMEKVMKEYDLHRTPAGRLAAAKIVAAEGKTSKSKAEKQESDRVARVKGQLVEGDKAKSTDAKSPEKEKQNLKDKIFNEKSTDTSGTSDWINQKGLREKFGRVWGQ